MYKNKVDAAAKRMSDDGTQDNRREDMILM